MFGSHPLRLCNELLGPRCSSVLKGKKPVTMVIAMAYHKMLLLTIIWNQTAAEITCVSVWDSELFHNEICRPHVGGEGQGLSLGHGYWAPQDVTSDHNFGLWAAAKRFVWHVARTSFGYEIWQSFGWIETNIEHCKVSLIVLKSNLRQLPKGLVWPSAHATKFDYPPCRRLQLDIPQRQVFYCWNSFAWFS